MSTESPPHSSEAEEYLISACLLDEGATLSEAMAAGIKTESFFIPANRIIFDAITSLHAEDRPIDLAMVSDRLKSLHLIDSIGGYAYLVQVSGRTGTTADVHEFIDKVVNLDRVRSVMAAARRLIDIAKAYTHGSAQEFLGKSIEALQDHCGARAAVRSWRDVCLDAKAEAMEKMKPATERDPKLERNLIHWAWGNIDHEFYPMERGELVVVAAATSTYKSTMVRQQAVHASGNGLSCLFSSLEVTDTELAINLAANISGIRSRRDLDTLHEADKFDLLSGFDSLANLKKFTCCHTDEWMSELLGRARSFKAKNGLDLWVIDYLQLIFDCKFLDRGQTEASAIGKVTATLKRFASKEGCVVLLVAQPNREASKQDNREPVLSDLYGSSSIEKDASRVIFLHRPNEIPAAFNSGISCEQSATDDRDWHFIRVIQAKGRNFGTGQAALRADRAIATLRRIDAPKAPSLR